MLLPESNKLFKGYKLTEYLAVLFRLRKFLRQCSWNLNSLAIKSKSFISVNNTFSFSSAASLNDFSASYVEMVLGVTFFP